MRKVRLTESDLNKIVRRVLREQAQDQPQDAVVEPEKTTDYEGISEKFKKSICR